jgi:hypothetical protein
MSRTIVVTDDEQQTIARIEISNGTASGHVVRRVVIETEADSGLPDELLDALVPYVGLPAARGHRGMPLDALPQVANPAPDPGEPDRRGHLSAAPTPAHHGAWGTPVIHSVPAPREPEPEPEPEPQRPQDPQVAPPRRGRAAKYTKPTEHDFKKVVRTIGGKRADLAKYFGVPGPIINNWQRDWRKQHRSR